VRRLRRRLGRVRAAGRHGRRRGQRRAAVRLSRRSGRACRRGAAGPVAPGSA
jgi:hypothetical protein